MIEFTETTKTIFDQLGGQHFLIITGSRIAFCKDNTIRIILAEDTNTIATHLDITYDPGTDTYRMEFFKFTPSIPLGGVSSSFPRKDTIKVYFDVFWEDLQRLFTAEAGFFTSLH